MKTSDRKLLKGYFWNHDAIRKDMDRIKKVIEHFSEYKAADFSKIEQWFHYHEQCILFHHHGEDDFFFPVMRERKPQFKIELDSMEHEHVLLDEQLDAMKKILAELSGGATGLEAQFKSLAQAYINLIITHLDKEEVIVETIVQDIPENEILKTEDDYRKTMTKKQMSVTMPWMIDAMDEKDKSYFFGMVPFFVKWIYNLSAKPKFTKLTEF